MSDFGPLMPYSDYLRRELESITPYAYINPSLDRRYDPVVVGGNAMHPVIQSGDVILIDTAMKTPEQGQAVAVKVDDNRTVIGYWRVKNSIAYLEQERTEKVITLDDYTHWSIYGVVTKVIGRGIAPKPPEVALREEESKMPDVTPGQAQYVVERLLRERRITNAEVDRYVGEIGKEIAEIERRLAEYRSGTTTPKPNVSSIPVPKKRRKASKKAGRSHPRGIAGTFAVLLRALPENLRASYQKMREERGLKHALAELKKAQR